MSELYVGINRDYKTVTEAIKAAVSGDVILIDEGRYYEKLHIETDNISLIGKDAKNTVIFYDDYAKKLNVEGKPMGTSNTYTVWVSSDKVSLKNLTIENTSGNGRDYGQAVALRATGDCFSCKDCILTACQDTLFAGCGTQSDPNAIWKPERQYYGNCIITGDIDFIFGAATAYFDKCTIFSKNNITEEDIYFEEKRTKGYVAAACTWKDNNYGYVFNECRLESDCEEATVYLARPWRQYSKTVFINCYMGSHIKPEGFHDWEKMEAHTDSYYGEYGSYGPGANKERAEWSHKIEEKDLDKYSVKKVLADFKI